MAEREFDITKSALYLEDIPLLISDIILCYSYEKIQFGLQRQKEEEECIGFSSVSKNGDQ